MGKYVNQYWKDPEIAPTSYHKFKSWKNIPDIVLSIDTSIRQQLVNNKTCRKEKLQESVKETNYRVCDNDQETVPHILCGCSQMAQTLYKDRHDKTRRPLYHSVRKKTNLVNLSSSSRGISKATRFHVWRKRKCCGIFHGIWKNSPETEQTNLM